jgi:predicted enzyme related to lactoylglutathione lyase
MGREQRTEGDMGEVSRHPSGTFCWMDLTTTDVAATKAFYSALYGWETEDIPAGGGASSTMCRLGGHAVAAMYEQPVEQGSAEPPRWSSHISVDEVDAVAGKARDLGASVITEPFDAEDAGRISVIQDPTGAVVCLWQPKSSIGAELVNEPGTWTWNELATRDPEGARAFYGELFGWGCDELVEGQYFSFTLGDLLIGSMRTMVNDPPQVPPNWMPYFVVAGCDEAAGQVRELGGRIVVPPTDIPAGRFAVMTDSQGAASGLVEIPEGPKRGVDGS